MYLMLQREKPGDYVIATGIEHSVRECVELAFKEIGVTIEWREKGLKEKGLDKNTGKVLVEIDPRYFRPVEVDSLQGDATKAKQELKWSPKIGFAELIKEMVASDLKSAKLKDGHNKY
jgi:GDPmannose 4,6-dehydratase